MVLVFGSGFLGGGKVGGEGEERDGARPTGADRNVWIV